MKYSASVQLINIAFILIFFFTPILIAVSIADLSLETGRFLIVLSFFLVALALVDWYYLYLSNSFTGIVYNFLLFSGVSLGAVVATMLLSSHDFSKLALLKDHELWENYNILLRIYFTGLGIVIITALSLPRLVLIRLLFKSPLPG